MKCSLRDWPPQRGFSQKAWALGAESNTTPSFLPSSPAVDALIRILSDGRACFTGPGRAAGAGEAINAQGHESTRERFSKHITFGAHANDISEDQE